MKANEDLAQKWIGLSEGGLTDNKHDPGGRTCRGITQDEFSAWLRRQGKPGRDVATITKDEAETIIAQQYFRPIWFDELPSGLDYAMGDYSVNSGPHQATLDLQRTLNSLGQKIKVDGALGNITLDAVDQASAAGLILGLCQRRMAFLRRLRTFQYFGKGWTRRVIGEKPGVQNWDSGVLDRATRMARGKAITSQPKNSPGRAVGKPMSAPVAFVTRALHPHEWRIGR